MAQKSFKFSLLVILAFAAMSILAFAQTAEAEDFTPETAEPEKFYVALVTEVTELEAGKIVVVEIIKGERKGEKIYMHRIINNTPKNLFTDHINRNKLDNRQSNLRSLSPSESSQNRGLFRNNTSGYRGVTWDKLNKKWLAQIYTNKKQVCLGRYISIKDAILIRKQAELNYKFI